MFDYENYLASKIDLYNTEGLTVRIATEEIFQKTELKEDEIYVVINRLSSVISLEGKTEPIQITILSEANSENKAKELFERVASNLNWVVETEEDGEDTYTIKQQYVMPVSMNKFMGIENSYRSILYVQATILYLKNVVDVDYISIDGMSLKPLSLSYAFQTQGNTQQISGDNIATTEKSVSTIVISMTIPMQDVYKLSATQTKTVNVVSDGQVEYIPSSKITSVSDSLAVKTLNKVVFHTLGSQTINYTYSLVNAILLVSSGRYSGGKKFNIKIDDLFIDRDFVLTGATFTFAPNSVPSLVLGWIA